MTLILSGICIGIWFAVSFAKKKQWGKAILTFILSVIISVFIGGIVVMSKAKQKEKIRQEYMNGNYDQK